MTGSTILFFSLLLLFPCQTFSQFGFTCQGNSRHRKGTHERENSLRRENLSCISPVKIVKWVDSHPTPTRPMATYINRRAPGISKNVSTLLEKKSTSFTQREITEGLSLSRNNKARQILSNAQSGTQNNPTVTLTRRPTENNPNSK